MTGTPAPTPSPTPSFRPAPRGPEQPQQPEQTLGAVDLLRAFVAQRSGGEVRPQQEHMVAVVENAIATKRHAVIQAGTGTGKSYGYMIPAVASGGGVVISTASNQLAEQVYREDLPTLATLLPQVGGPEFTYALVKGRANYACFSGATQVLTYDGLRAIGDLVGTTACLLDGDGRWVESPVRDFGEQEIVELTLSRQGVTRVIETTANHRWFVQKLASSKDVTEIVTFDLQPGMRLKYQGARPMAVTGKGLRPSPFGVAHGVTFGDGTRFAPTVNGWVTGTITLHGAKDAELLPFFNGSHTVVTRLSDDHTDETAIRVCDLPNRFKDLPPLDEAPSYLYGWLAGYFAADGAVGMGATPTLHSASKANLEFVTAICARLGIRCGEIGVTHRVGKNTSDEPTALYHLSLSASTLTDDFFLLSLHRQRIAEHRARVTYKQDRAARRWKVESVRATGRRETVYCAEVPTTASFVLAGNILTGNCKSKIDALVNLDDQDPDDGLSAALFDVPQPTSARRPSREDLTALNSLLKWADTTTTGDRSEAPATTERAWADISTDSAGCPGAKACPFGQECFAEAARSNARQADVVVTNHAQVAQDLRSPNPMLGEYDVLIADETHELESYLSSAWGHEVVPSALKHTIALAVRKAPRTKDGESAKSTATSVVADLDALTEMLREQQAGRIKDLPQPLEALLLTIARKLISIATILKAASEARDATAQVAADRKGAASKVAEACEAVTSVLTASTGTVRWLDKPRDPSRDRRGPVLKTAPLWVGPQLMSLLADKTLISTSATITVGGSFDSMVRTLALTEPVAVENAKPTAARGFDVADVGTPFDYDQQALLYIPGRDFPAPVGRDRTAHTAAVLDDVVALVRAAGGRTLALFATRRDADNAAAHLRAHVSTPVLAQGEAPPSQLVAQFAEVEESTLVATLGFWHGVNVPGPSLSLVIMDRIPFPPLDDPLMAARREAADAQGRDGFDAIFVARAAVMLAQGAGRLVRTLSDRGVVAVLDPRLRTKRYGATLVSSLPPMRQFTDRAVVEGALQRLAASLDARHGAPTRGSKTSGAPSAAGTPRQALPSPRASRSAAVPQEDRGPAPSARRAAPSRASTRALARTTKGTG